MGAVTLSCGVIFNLTVSLDRKHFHYSYSFGFALNWGAGLGVLLGGLLTAWFSDDILQTGVPLYLVAPTGFMTLTVATVFTWIYLMFPAELPLCPMEYRNRKKAMSAVTDE